MHPYLSTVPRPGFLLCQLYLQSLSLTASKTVTWSGTLPTDSMSEDCPVLSAANLFAAQQNNG